MIVYIYDDKEGKTNAISIDKKNWCATRQENNEK